MLGFFMSEFGMLYRAIAPACNAHEATISRTVRIMRGFADGHIISAVFCVNFRTTCFEVSQGMTTCVNLFFRYTDDLR